MFLNRIFCIFGKHKPDRHKVRHNGHTFVGRCKHCGTPMMRDGPKSWSAVPVRSE